MRPIIIVLALFISPMLWAQKYKPFEGTIFYDVYFQKSVDSVPYKVNYLTLRVKDSLVRVDTNSDSFGAQTTIRNMNQKKSYVLLKNEEQYYAIKQYDNDSISTHYTFKKMGKKRKLDGFTMKRTKRISTKGEVDTLYYFPQINPKYLNLSYPLIGLPAEYKVPVNEESFLIYRAIKIEEKQLDEQLFQIPSIFKIISMDEFIMSQQSLK